MLSTRVLRGASEYLRLRSVCGQALSAAPLDVALESLSRGRCVPLSRREAAWVVRLSEPVAARILGGTCLHRASCRYALLRRAGLDARFVLGAPTEEHAGHAWVELSGRPFAELGVPRFARVLVHPAYTPITRAPAFP